MHVKCLVTSHGVTNSYYKKGEAYVIIRLVVVLALLQRSLFRGVPVCLVLLQCLVSIHERHEPDIWFPLVSLELGVDGCCLP